MQMGVYRQLRLILCASFLQKIVDVRASQARYFDPKIASNSFACPSPTQHLQNLNLTGRQNKSTVTSSLQSCHPLNLQSPEYDVPHAQHRGKRRTE